MHHSTVPTQHPSAGTAWPRLSFDEKPAIGYGMAMTDRRQTLNQIIDFCSEKWGEANQPPKSDWPTPDMRTGQKMAFNEVIQYVRKLLSEAS
jgi:hypothetical protein